MGDIQCQPELTYRQNHEFTTRHITPQICVSAGGKSTGSSAATSRTTSRLSGASSIQVNVFIELYLRFDLIQFVARGAMTLFMYYVTC